MPYVVQTHVNSFLYSKSGSNISEERHSLQGTSLGLCCVLGGGGGGGGGGRGTLNFVFLSVT